MAELVAFPAPVKAQRGLVAIVDDAPAGKVPGGFARDFVLIFRAELEARFVNGGQPCAATPASNPSDCA